MPVPPIVPNGESLRRAFIWLAERGPWTLEIIEQACQRFDLSPTDEEFLLQEYRRLHKQAKPPATA